MTGPGPAGSPDAGARPVGGEAGATTEAITGGARREGGMPFGRSGPRIARMVWLTLVWVLLWGTFSWANLLSGLLVAALVVRFFPLPGVPGGGRLRPTRLLRAIGRVAVDLLVSSVQVARQSVRPGPPVRSSIVRVQLSERSELLTAVLVEALSLVPGSVVVEADAARGLLWAHVLGADAAGVAAWRARVRALESDLVAAGLGGAPATTPPPPPSPSPSPAGEGS